MMDKGAPRGTRTGFTTGACSAAAARAATIGLVTGQVPDAVECLLPNGDLVNMFDWVHNAGGLVNPLDVAVIRSTSRSRDSNFLEPHA